MTGNSHERLYPLRFAEILRDYSFGQRWIVREFAKSGLPEGHRVGETWEVCDRPKESSRVINGPLAGRTLHELIGRFGPALLGERIAHEFGGRFPLLIKFLDATHSLGEQVHTNDELTARWGIDDYSGKTEAWYMLRTLPGAQVFCGQRPGLTRQQLAAAMLNGQSRDCMAQYPAHAGDAFLLYAGTMHYSPGGLLFYEIMQNSDVYTSLARPDAKLPQEQRLAQAARAVQAVHLEEGYDCRARPVTLPRDGANVRRFVCACRHFVLERLELSGPERISCDGGKFLVLTAIEGSTRLTCGGNQELLLPGQSVLLPACLGQATLEPQKPSAVLKAYVPDLAADVVAPLREAGIADADIAALGGQTRLNDLAPEGP